MFEILVTEKLHFNVVFRNSTVPVPRFAVKKLWRASILMCLRARTFLSYKTSFYGLRNRKLE